MLSSEHCTLGYVVRHLNAPPNQKIDVATIRQAMVILLHHNCLTVEMMPDYDGDETAVLSIEARSKLTGLLYTLNVDNILNRLRFAKVIKIARDRFIKPDMPLDQSQLAVLIMEEVILHGRVRLPQIRQAVTQTVERDAEEYSNLSYLSTQEICNKVQSTFENLVQNRFLVTVAPLDIKRRAIPMMEGGKVKAKNSVFSQPSVYGQANANAAGK